MSRLTHTLIKGCYKLPDPFKKAISPAYSRLITPFWLGGSEYIKKKKFLLKSQWWPREKLEEYQLKQLHVLIAHAYDNVPYYKALFKKLNLTPDSVRYFEDLEKLPLLTREDIIKHFDKLIAKNITKNKYKICQTSGSTGNHSNSV